MRSRSALIQTIGRAARNVDGRVILYADKETNAIKQALDETNRRRQRQEDYNTEHGITPTSVTSEVRKGIEQIPKESSSESYEQLSTKELRSKIKSVEKEMKDAASNLEFEEAARLRDLLRVLENRELELF